MASTSDDLARLLVSIELTQSKIDKQLASIAKRAEREANAIDGSFKAANSNIGKSFDSGARAADRSLRSTRAAATNLSFQLNDIATQLASGTSPFQVMAQQGGQVVQSLTGAGGVLGALRIVGAAALNPFTLATVAITTLAGVATAYFRDTSDSVEDATKKMEEHRTAVRAAIDAWDGAPPPELIAYADELDRIDKQSKKLAGLQVVIDKELEPINEAARAAAEGFDELYARLQARNVDARILSNLKRDFDAMKEAIDGGNASALDLLPLFTRLQELEGQIGTTKGFDALKKAIQDMAAELDKVNSKLETTRKAAAAVRSNLDPNIYGGGGNQGFFPTINLPNTAPTPELGDFSGLLPTQSRDPFVAAGEAAAAAMIRRFEGFRQDAYWDVNAFRTGFGSDTVTRSNGMIEKVTSETIVTLDEAEADLSRRIAEFQAGIQAAIGPDRWRAMTADQQAALTSVAYNYGSLPGSVVSAITGGGNVANAIAGLSANPGRRAQEAAAFGGATIDTAAVQQATDAWAGLRSETQQTAAVTQQVGQEYSTLQTVGVTALNGLKNALADGKIEGKELLGIILDIVQQLLTMPTPQGGGGGGFGIFGSILSGLLGGGIPGFANGTRAAPGGLAWVGERGPELVSLPRGSQVTPNHSLGAPRLGGRAAATPQPQPVTIAVQIDGANGDDHVRNLVAQGVRAGIGQYDKTLNSTFGKRMTMAQTRQL